MAGLRVILQTAFFFYQYLLFLFLKSFLADITLWYQLIALILLFQVGQRFYLFKFLRSINILFIQIFLIRIFLRNFVLKILTSDVTVIEFIFLVGIERSFWIQASCILLEALLR